VQLKSSVRGYQRLLSGDTHKLAEFLQAELHDSSANAVLEQTIVPVVKNVLSDRDALGVNDVIMFDRLWASMLKVGLLADPTSAAHAESPELEETRETAPSGTVPTGTAPAESEPSNLLPAVVQGIEVAVAVPEVVEPAAQLPLGAAIAARHRGEEILLSALAYSLRESLRLEIFVNNEFPDRELQALVALAPAVIVIGVIPPGGTHQARYWCRALREAGYKGFIVVACLGRFKNFDQLFVGFRKSGANWFTTTVDQTSQKLKSIADRAAGSTRKLSVLPDLSRTTIASGNANNLTDKIPN